MLIKRAYYSGTEDEPLVRVLTPGESVKTAGLEPAVLAYINALKPDSKYTYTLCNAMGYSEYFGANSNADWYGLNPHLSFNGLLNDWAGIGNDIELDQMKGKQWAFGYPCFYNAAVYAHHNNTDPLKLGFGDVIYAYANHVMKRIELVMRVSNDEAAKKGHSSILDRVARGERVDVSMGAKVPFDLCSICTDWAEVKKALRLYEKALITVQEKKTPGPVPTQGQAILTHHRFVRPIRGLAVTRADYCDCMRTRKNQVGQDGKKVFVYNDFPRFFDISYVWVGADRTARVIWHLGATEPSRTRPSASPEVVRMLETLFSGGAKTASIDKEIPGGLAESVHADADSSPVIDTKPVIDSIGGSSVDAVKKVLTALAALGIVVSPAEFHAMVLPVIGGGDVCELLEQHGATFDTAQRGVDNTFSVSASLFSSPVADALSPWLGQRSSFAPFLSKRLQSTNKTAGTKRSALKTPLLDKVAAQYNGYRLSVLEAAPELFPKVAAYIEIDPLEEKRSGVAEAALLLGLAPVIHLVSSHIRQSLDEGKQVGSVAQFVANNPTFSTMLTVGAALRAAMAIGTVGSIPSAAKAVASALAGVT